MSAGVVLQAILSGLAAGAVYGLVALGVTLVWRLTRVLALAHGDLVVGAVFLAVLAVLGAAPVATLLSPGPAVLLVVLTLAAGALLSAAAYLLAIRPFLPGVGTRRAAPSMGDAMGWVAATVAAGLLLRELLGLALPAQGYAVPDPLRLQRLVPGARDGVLSLPGGGTLPARLMGVLVVGLLVGVVVERAVVRSRYGRAMRAVADDPEAAALCGIPTGRVVLVAFVLAGLLAGLAGLLDAPGRSLSPDDGVVLGLKGIAAALLGRLGSLPGALAGGLALGVVEALAVASPLLGAAWADVLALAVLVVVLAVRPEGLRSRPAAALE